MSWGLNDSIGNGQSSLYKYFSNPKICYCAASGDSNTPSFPSTHSNVLSVGGTTLTSISPRTEITWTLGGSGYSSQILKPTYQNGVTSITKNFRAIPDVAAIANPSNGVMICYNGVFYVVGGTSAAAPLFSGILSIAIQKRLNAKKLTLLTTVDNPPPATSINLQAYLYKSVYNNNYKNTLYNSCFNDILTGTDGSFQAVAGYDLATGLGSPNCTNLCNSLALL
jgi:kumamolisin